MATLIRMPEVAAGATEIVLSKWQVTVGASVKVGDVLAEMETEKAVVDYMSEAEGTVYKIMVADGASVEVGSPILVLLAAGEDGSAGDALLGGAAAPAAPFAAPAATPVAVAAPTGDGGRRFVSPIVRKLGAQLGVDLTQIVGTGPDGRVVRRDLEHFVANGGAASSASPVAVPADSAPAASTISAIAK